MNVFKIDITEAQHYKIQIIDERKDNEYGTVRVGGGVWRGIDFKLNSIGDDVKGKDCWTLVLQKDRSEELEASVRHCSDLTALSDTRGINKHGKRQWCG